MRFPKRTDEHIRESAAWRVLQSKAPSEWIIREVTERDYGVDAYVELATSSGNISGDLCSVQLKGCGTIHWKGGPESETKRARSRGIKKSTLRYLMNLPVPVFLVVADLSTNKVYFTPIKKGVRDQYAKFCDKKQKSISFELQSFCELGTQLGDLCFRVLYEREKTFGQFLDCLRELILHCREYYEFIVCTQGFDCFLCVEDDEQLTMLHIYRSCLLASRFLGLDWNVTDLAEALKKDRENWKDSSCLLHHMTLSQLLKELEPVFIEIIHKAQTLVTKQMKDYLAKTDYILYRSCEDINVEQLKKGHG